MRHIPTTSSQDDAVSIVRRSPADDMTHAAAGSPPVVDAPPSGGTIRKLWSIEADRFRDHLLRLDTTSRRMRFAHAVSDGFIEEYASRMGANGTIIYGWFYDDELHATAELRRTGETWGQEAEVAFSVEPAFQNRGIATELMGRVIRSARNRGVRHLVMTCLSDNAKMQAVARHYDAELRFEQGEVLGELLPDAASAGSMMAEAFDDRMGYLMAVFEVPARPRKAA
ncbi:MAG: GNAT family N-acetyltransferase [Hyphomicrobium aestuarii]|nr:GNAT family N-acetyltransferase [Hyphomicrobium aestuarii]